MYHLLSKKYLCHVWNTWYQHLDWSKLNLKIGITVINIMGFKMGIKISEPSYIHYVGSWKHRQANKLKANWHTTLTLLWTWTPCFLQTCLCLWMNDWAIMTESKLSLLFWCGTSLLIHTGSPTTENQTSILYRHFNQHEVEHDWTEINGYCSIKTMKFHTDYKKHTSVFRLTCRRPNIFLGSTSSVLAVLLKNSWILKAEFSSTPAGPWGSHSFSQQRLTNFSFIWITLMSGRFFLFEMKKGVFPSVWLLWRFDVESHDDDGIKTFGTWLSEQCTTSFLGHFWYLNTSAGFLSFSGE